MGYIYKLDLITSVSLICKHNYSSITTKRLSKLKLSVQRRSKFTIEIASPLNYIIIGLLLGDGHIQKRSLTGNSRFMYTQSSLRKHHLNYFNHVLELFQPFLSKDFNLKHRNFTDKKNNNVYSSVQFATLSLPCFNYYKDLFYKSDNTKIVPLNIENLLTPIGLAYWIMDDGSLQNKGLHLNTYGFTNQDILRLKTALENIFGENTLKCSIHKHKKGNRIYIWEESMVLIRNNISQFMHKDMLYKINCPCFFSCTEEYTRVEILI